MLKGVKIAGKKYWGGCSYMGVSETILQSITFALQSSISLNCTAKVRIIFGICKYFMLKNLKMKC